MPPAKGYTHAQAMRRLALCFFPGYQLREANGFSGQSGSEPRHYVLDSRVRRWVSLMACRRTGSNATGTRYAASVCTSASRRQYTEPQTAPPFGQTP
ncbi:hypothetical protein M441DRAFT_231406 [Trichoderma asperellum CBS 433.97]|uniref:Uncharacterized protein n=1 Tax=Trichoderma asperellum (strain ATCC 204424 / CBS 433.97 / NBRC 101777) TaxID=1042311 RepID=A0A2T3ZQQ2_TRIA4|nr:hypothetical protein M441DRAFT_231406 [Trichoderma asperellum CBS 433.97]PTB47114.1 hypothetical protein M441DRAFT_231406 [Trichoderma asperellum CBS 433.97]